jgi:hypothetical protein
VVEVLIEEMFGSDRSRPKDYRRAVVIDAGPKNKTNEDTLRSERRSALKKTFDRAEVVRDVRLARFYLNAMRRGSTHFHCPLLSKILDLLRDLSL